MSAPLMLTAVAGVRPATSPLHFPTIVRKAEQARYGAIMIDPPWQFEVWGGTIGSRSAESHYGVMTENDLLGLDLKQIMNDDCAVFLWTTWTHLPLALQLGEKWGISYKTCAFNWVKLNKTQSDTPFTGMGYWTRANSEPCLLFTRGNPKRLDKGVPQMLVEWTGGMFDAFETETIATRIGRHSEKPNAAYQRVEALVEGPYCEVFARQRRAGWDAIGNEIDGRDIRDVLRVTA